MLEILDVYIAPNYVVVKRQVSAFTEPVEEKPIPVDKPSPLGITGNFVPSSFNFIHREMMLMLSGSVEGYEVSLLVFYYFYSVSSSEGDPALTNVLTRSELL